MNVWKLVYSIAREITDITMEILNALPALCRIVEINICTKYCSGLDRHTNTIFNISRAITLKVLLQTLCNHTVGVKICTKYLLNLAIHYKDTSRDRQWQMYISLHLMGDKNSNSTDGLAVQKRWYAKTITTACETNL